MRKVSNEVQVAAGSEGFVFATTGTKYTTLARRAARTLRLSMPDAQIDLFTDMPLDDVVFDQIHLLEQSWFRPKMQAIRESRFERSIVLDADMIVLADISEIFRVLDRYDIAGVDAVHRTSQMVRPKSKLPRCLPPVNSGLLAVRASKEVRAFAQTWEDSVRRSGSNVDQPALRRLLYKSDLRFASLGMEYNLIWLDLLDIWSKFVGAPRVLHVGDLHAGDPGDPETPFSLAESIGKRRARHVERLLSSDWTLDGDPDLEVVTPHREMRIVQRLAGPFIPTGVLLRLRNLLPKHWESRG